MQRLWYVAYGTNLSRARFELYLTGGRAAEGGRDHPGCRDPAAPEADLAITVPGGLRFVGVSSIWGGGMAVYDAGAAGAVAARAYLISAEQFVDVLAQEMRLEPGIELDLDPLHERGSHSLGPGRYQTLTTLGTQDGLPMITFTSGDLEGHRLNPPAEGYLRTMADGLWETHRWPAHRIACYLAAFPGVAGRWSRASIEMLAAPSPSREWIKTEQSAPTT